MPLYRQKLILPEDLRANPNTLFLFGDNNLRKGRKGQAGSMRGLPNAIGVRTKWAPSRDDSAYFTDHQEAQVLQMWIEDLAPLRPHHVKGGIVVMPLDGLGTGLSELPQRAPRLAEILVYEIELIFSIPVPRGQWSASTPS